MSLATDFGLNPSKFYSFTDLARHDSDRDASLSELMSKAVEAVTELETRSQVLARSNNNMMNEWRMTTRKKRAGSSDDMETDDNWTEDFRHSSDGMNFLRIAYEVTTVLTQATGNVCSAIQRLRSPDLMIPSNRMNLNYDDFNSIQAIRNLIDINSPSLSNYLDALSALEELPGEVAKMSDSIANILSTYHRALVKRHSIDGFKIHRNAVITDVAMHIYENVDSDGEVEDGQDPDKLSAYSMRKAQIMAEALRDPFVDALIKGDGEISGFTAFLTMSLRSLFELSRQLTNLFRSEIGEYRRMTFSRQKTDRSDQIFNSAIGMIKDLDPAAVQYRPKEGLLSQEELFVLEFKNETLSQLVSIYMSGYDPALIIARVLERKAKLRNHFQDENSFYVCRISSGNTFLGQAPGALQVTPGTRPLASFDDILGSGFVELKDHVRTIKGAATWHDLFVATSPSKTSGKSNILLIGPQGCGKCVTGDTLVYTSQGLVRIDSLNPGVNEKGYGPLSVTIKSLNGVTKSSQFYDSGIQPVISVISRHGYKTIGTDKHRLICSSSSGLRWKRLDEIKPSDYVAIIRDNILPTNDGLIDDSKAYVYGYYVGDGSTSGPSSRPKAIRFSVNTEDLDDFKAKAYPYLKQIGNPRSYKDSRGAACYDVQVSGLNRRSVKAFRDECGHGAANKRVPEWVLKSDTAVWIFFLRGLFDADGSTYGRRVELSSNSQDLIRTVQLMLLGLGIVSMIQRKRSNLKSWRLFIYGENLRKFYEVIGFEHPRKMLKLKEECRSSFRNDNYDIIPISHDLWVELRKQSGKLTRKIHKLMDHYARAGHNPSRRVLKKIIEQLPDSKAKSHINDLMDDGIFWDRVVSVKPDGDRPVFDLVIPDGESFAANGFMNHNTEAMRAVASEKDSIAVFVMGSDFNSCWKGESQKNPKRLFEAALKLQKDTKKHVHILIDEVDAVMKKKEFLIHGDDDLTTEFQNLMDGVVHYPNITVWGATNHPERIPMPMIRRFSKVIIVGELDQEQREVLFRKFLSYLPVEDFDKGDLRSFASRLEGATGDVLRKIVDHIWRHSMQRFVDQKPEEASKMIQTLNARTKFNVAEFTPEQREEFKAELRRHFTIPLREVRDAIESHLKNFAIKTEIQTATESYNQAKKFVADLSSSSIIT